MKYILYILFLFSFCACNRQDNKNGKAIQLFKEGQFLEEQNLPDSALKVYCKAVDLLDQTKDNELLGKIYLQWGNLLTTQGLGLKALQISQKALFHVSKLNNSPLVPKALRNIGKSYVLLDLPAESIKYYEQALRQARQNNNEEEFGYIYNNLSFIYRSLNQFDKAIEYSNLAIESSKDSINLFKNYSNRGQILIGLKQYDSAWYYTNLGSQSSDIFTRASCYRTLSQLSFLLGKSDSTKYLKLSQEMNDKIRGIRNIISATKVGDVFHQYEINQSIEEHNKQTSFYYILIAVCGVVLIVVFLFGFRLKTREINRLKCEISAKQNQILEITQNYQSAEKENGLQLSEKFHPTDESGQLQKRIAVLINEIGILCAKRFVMTKIYSKTKKQLSEASKIEESDLKEFRHTIFTIFKDYINCLAEYYPKLTQNDHYFCCLFKLRLKISECSVLENRTKYVLYTQKSRIKDRLDAEPNTDYILGLIFNTAEN